MENGRLTKQEEHALIFEAQKGNDDAKCSLIKCYQDMILKMAYHYYNQNIDFHDLYAEGLLGFIEAITRFDLQKDVYLSTFAFYWIKKRMIQYLLLNNKALSVSLEDYDLLKKYENLMVKFQAQNITPTLEDYVFELHISKQKVLELLSLNEKAVSLNGKINENDPDFIDQCSMTIDDKLIHEDLKKQIRVLFDKAKLKEKHITVLNLRFGLTGLRPMTLEEVAEILNVRIEGVRYLETFALKKLRISEECNRFLIYSQNPKKAEENLQTFREHYKTPHAKLVKSISQIKGR